MTRGRRRPLVFWQIWLWPVVLAALTVFGLLSALLGQHGLWHWLSWIALSFPLALIVLLLLRARRSGGFI